MSRLAQRLKLWLNDPLLQRLLRNGEYCSVAAPSRWY